MGSTRKELIAEITRAWGWGTNGEQRNECIAHTTRGNVLWSVWERGKKDRYIVCYLLKNGGKEYGWGHKGMSESTHPYYYTCPLKYLDMVPPRIQNDCPGRQFEVTCAAWREKVREYHTEQKAQRDRIKQLKMGMTVKLIGSTVPEVKIVSVNPLRGMYMKTRTVYKIPRKMVGEVI